VEANAITAGAVGGLESETVQLPPTPGMMLIGEQANDERAPGRTSKIPVVRATPERVAVITADCGVENDPALAVNDAEAAFAGTVTIAGTAIAGLLLMSDTIAPPVFAAPVNVTVQAVLLKANRAASVH
jgi:hypothetical protein